MSLDGRHGGAGRVKSARESGAGYSDRVEFPKLGKEDRADESKISYPTMLEMTDGWNDWDLPESFRVESCESSEERALRSCSLWISPMVT